MIWTLAYKHLRRYLINHFENLVTTWSRRIYGRTGSPRVYRLTKTTAVKFCVDAGSQEADTMKYIRDQTSIPIPKVLDAWTNGNDGIIVMEWVEGKNIKALWPHLSTQDKQHMAGQLKKHLDELRSLQQTTKLTGWIGTYDKQPFSDSLLSNKLCGPFASYQEFNQFLVSRLAFMESSEEGRLELEVVRNDILKMPRPQIVFTHADIAARNILLNNQCDVVAILDWEMAGWMPEQWEYLKAMWMGQYDDGWPEFVHMFLEPYSEDLRIHNEMCRMHGAPF